MKKALITGICGQDGSYLAELLLSKGYRVYGIDARELGDLSAVTFYPVSICDHAAIDRIIQEVKPDEFYHFASVSYVDFKYSNIDVIVNVNINATHNILVALKNYAPACKLYFSGSSEMFGNTTVSPQNEQTRFNPRNMYGITKLAGYHMVKNYRDQFGLFACTGITYNHESIRRGHEFVTRKISSTVAKIYLGLESKLVLGNIDAVRDWGYAPDYVEAMWMMLNRSDTPQDYVIATGVGHTVRNFLEMAFSSVGLDYRAYVEINQDYVRPADAVPLIGDASAIKKTLGWHTTKCFEDFVREMVAHDVKLLQGNDANVNREKYDSA